MPEESDAFSLSTTPKPSRPCRRCGAELPQRAAFCQQCGCERPTNIIKRRASDRHENDQRWKAVRDTIAFYTIILATIIPLAWVDESSMATAQLIVSGIDAIIITATVFIWRIPILPTLAFKRTVKNIVPITVGLLIALLGFNLLYHHILLTIFPGITELQYRDAFDLAGYGLAIQLFSIAVMPAIWEEIAFRGLIQERLQRLLSPSEALILTSILFGIIHCNFWSAPVLIIIGIGLGWLRLKTGSLLPSIIVHGLHNACILLLEYV